VLATLIAIYFVGIGKSGQRLLSKEYLIFLSSPWKLVSFVFATVCFSVLSRYANDPTWDIPETIIMASLTFSTAPWAVGVIYRAIYKQEVHRYEIYTALCIWLFSASWSYDLYVWIWLGSYPLSWSGNLMISPILYLFAGMFWNLESRKGI
jgi:hypothetical protein